MPTDGDEKAGMPPARTSGGKRATTRKHVAYDAARERAKAGNWREAWVAELEANVGAPPKDAEEAHAWLARAAVFVVYATLRDTAIPPEQMRRDVMRQIEQASKVLDPAKLAEQIAKLEIAVIEMESLKYAGDLEAGASRALSEAGLSSRPLG
jgi:hypothetical protein